MTSKTSLIIALTQGKSEPWESIWLDGQWPTWVSRYKDEVEIVNTSGVKMGRLWKSYDKLHEHVRYSKEYGLWQGRLDYLFIPWLSRNIPKSLELTPSLIREIEIQTNSSYVFGGRRLLGLIDWFLRETNYEYMFITTTSSLINVNQLIEEIQGLENGIAIYAGHLLGESPEKFVTGAGQLINRETAKLVVSKFREYPHQMLNDVALGCLLRNNGVIPIDIPWIWCKSVDEILELSDESLSRTMHFRCKTLSQPRMDSEVMLMLHQKLIKLRGQGIGRY